jgi:hypothetical protein
VASVRSKLREELLSGRVQATTAADRIIAAFDSER